jgi:hypothetical protein
MIREPMIDESLMAKIVSLNPADRILIQINKQFSLPDT